VGPIVLINVKCAKRNERASLKPCYFFCILTRTGEVKVNFVKGKFTFYSFELQLATAAHNAK
jgi:hypothetical protein